MRLKSEAVLRATMTAFEDQPLRRDAIAVETLRMQRM